VAAPAPAQHFKHFSTPTPLPSGSTLILGFLSGNDRGREENRPAIQLAQRLRALELPGVYVETAGSAQRGEALKFIQAAAARDPAGHCLPQGCRDIRIILYGNGDGAAGVVKAARELKTFALPIALLLRVDPPGACGGLIPSSVARAAEACCDDRWARHRQQIRAEDPARTQILANLRYSSEGRWRNISEATPPPEPRFKDSHLGLDPLLWNHVEDFILDELHRAGIPGAPAPPHPVTPPL